MTELIILCRQLIHNKGDIQLYVDNSDLKYYYRYRVFNTIDWQEWNEITEDEFNELLKEFENDRT